MTRFCDILTGLALTAILAMGVASAGAQDTTRTPGNSATKPQELGLIDVTQSDLLQKTIKNNWVSYNGDYTGQRYSALNQITPANASHLAAKWIFHTRNAGELEVTPIVVNGVMFITDSNDTYALDAQTGQLLWHHVRAITSGLVDDASAHINRGVAVLGTRVYMETDNAHLLCLDARSGDLIWDRAFTTGNKNYGATTAPIIVKNLVLVGESGGDDGVRGFLAAYNAQTGKQVWRFWTIPAPGEFGSTSWPENTWKNGCGTTWLPGTYDPELNSIYWGIGNPCPDYDGSVRPGDDLYTSSVVALNPDTGKLKWYFQINPHDLYDYDAAQTPVLVDTNFKGRPRKLLVIANKNGFLYIIDRTNGKYLFAKQFDQNENWAKGIDANGRPISNHLIPNAKGITVCPGPGGAANWSSPSYDPETNMFYFRSSEGCSLYQLLPETFIEGQTYYATGTRRPLQGQPFRGVYINAFDLSTLNFAWRDQQNGAGFSAAGVMSTAGGLVAFGNNAQEFEIDAARTGKPLWAFSLGQPMHASPMSYGINGKQYFAVAAGHDIIAFALP